MQFNYVDHEGYRRVDKRKAKRLFNLGHIITLYLAMQASTHITKL